MANAEHLAILKEGVEVWNKWRRENEEIIPDLSEADLSNASIQGAVFDRAKLSGINLAGQFLLWCSFETADLSKSNLCKVHFTDVNLIEADFTSANLNGATFASSKLNRANFTDANLSDVNLYGSNLTEAIFKNTFISGVDFRNANLSDVDLSEKNLAESKFQHANLADVNFTKSNLIGVDLSGAFLKDACLNETDLSGANLSHANLKYAHISRAILNGTILFESDLTGAKLIKTKLVNANLKGINFFGANLSESDLSNASLNKSDLGQVNFYNANLSGADLQGASFLETNLTKTNIQGAKVYGISAWNVKKEGMIQKDLVITKSGEPIITVDDLEIAQFIYLLLNNKKFRDVIETVTSKAVLILGNFTDERKKVLDAIRDELRNRNFLPILFDFEKPATRDLTETISTLANLSRFVIADLTEARSIPHELSHIIPFMPSLPIVPLILQGQQEYAMFEHWRSYPWVLPIYKYENEGHLISTLSVGVIEPAERKVQEIRGIK